MTAAITAAALTAGVVALGVWLVRRLLGERARRAVAEDDADEAAGDAEKRSRVTEALGQRRTRAEWAARARRVLAERRARRE